MSAPGATRTGLRRLGQWGNLLLGGVLMLLVWILLIWVGSRPALKTIIDLSPQGRGTIDYVTVELLGEFGNQDIQVEIHTFFAQPTGQPVAIRPAICDKARKKQQGRLVLFFNSDLDIAQRNQTFLVLLS